MPELPDRSALVIGGTGLLGRGVARELRADGWNVTVLSRGRGGVPSELSDCESLTIDRSDAAAFRAALADREFAAVIDCAAYHQPDALAAIETFRGHAGHYFFISTDFVYSADPSAAYPISEDAKTQNALPYAAGKLESEAALLDVARREAFPVTILRPPHILGAGRALGCDPAAGGRDDSLPERLRAGEEIPLLLDGQFLIQPVWSRDVGRCICALAGNQDTFVRIFNCAGGRAVTTRHYYQSVADLLGVPLRTRAVSGTEFLSAHPDKAHLFRHRIYDHTRLQEYFTPPDSLQEALSATLTWMESR